MYKSQKIFVPRIPPYSVNISEYDGMRGLGPSLKRARKTSHFALQACLWRCCPARAPSSRCQRLASRVFERTPPGRRVSKHANARALLHVGTPPAGCGVSVVSFRLYWAGDTRGDWWAREREWWRGWCVHDTWVGWCGVPWTPAGRPTDRRASTPTPTYAHPRSAAPPWP